MVDLILRGVVGIVGVVLHGTASLVGLIPIPGLDTALHILLG